MIDEYFVNKTNAVFEAAFANMTPQRTHPKTYTPTPKDQLPVPWYLQGFKDSAAGESELP